MELSEISVSKAKEKQFQSKGINSVEDLVKFLPRKHLDFSNPKPIRELYADTFDSVIGVVIGIDTSINNGNAVKVIIADGMNFSDRMEVLWFNQKYVTKFLDVGEKYIFCGKITRNKFSDIKQIISPIHFSSNINKYKRLMPVYSKIKGMSDEYLLKSMRKALKVYEPANTLPLDIEERYELISSKESILNLHNPNSLETLKQAKIRLIVEDLYYFAHSLKELNEQVIPIEGFKYDNFNDIGKFIESLPFKLTQGQQEVLDKTFDKLKNGLRLNDLVLGDVGCGKTIIALTLMILTVQNAGQTALMCPTAVLASQHYEDFKEQFSKLGLDISIAYLKSGMPKRERNKILKNIKDGSIDIVVGTHAVISEDVEFNNLRLTVVDEEHKFGVEQREKLKEKALEGVHSISMSATPIPRTLALVLYGEHIDIHRIKTLPKGRKPVETRHIESKMKSLELIKGEILKGRQAYIICPLVDESESEAMAYIESLKETYLKVKDFFSDIPSINVGSINGKYMNKQEIEEEIERFSNNETQILVSTTIVEVGVNVPNSTIIAINNAERFGLAQLHQLRGRVGRSSHQSYCLLISEREDDKIKIMCSSNDGYKIAEEDLKMRGAGEFIGVKQSGDDKLLNLAMKFPNLFEQLREYVSKKD